MSNTLPIDAIRPALEQAWGSKRNFILQAPTGSGKSTRVPRFLHEWEGVSSEKKILVLQPRRMAARLLARSVATEAGEAVGESVGYRIRFEANVSESTRIIYLTEGLLLRRLSSGDSLEDVGAILFDEFHERHLEGDIALGLALARQRAGWGGRIGIFSATLALEGLREYLPDAAILESEGRAYPVEVTQLGGNERTPVWEQAAQGFRKAIAAGAESDVLIFMPGKHEIRRTVEAIETLREAKGWDVYPLHGDLDARAQDQAIGTGTSPRVIVSTNIAETSLTLPGIRTVIDAGLARVPDFDPRRGVNTLLVEKISRASAEQRAGRAGRVAPGRCFRLWSKADHAHRPSFTPPEIARLDLSEIRLQLLAMGVESDFNWFEKPPKTAWTHAGALLENVGAMEHGTITDIGREMVRYPLHPRFSRMLVAAKEEGCLDLVIAAIAISEGKSLLLPIADKRKAKEREAWWSAAEGVSDLLKEVIVWEKVMESGLSMAFCREWSVHGQGARQVARVFRQLKALAGPSKDIKAGVDAFGKCLLAGYVDQLAKRVGKGTLRGELVHGRRGEIMKGSVIGEAPLFVAAEVEERTAKGEVTLFLSRLTAIREAWLEAVFPGQIERTAFDRLSREGRRIERVEQTIFRDLVLQEKLAGAPDAGGAARVLAQHIQTEGWPLKHWNDEAESWIRRLNILAHYCPELDVQAIGEGDRALLLEQICEGAISYKAVKDRPVLPVLQSWLPDTLLPLLDEWVPVRFELPGKGRPKLRYEKDGTVVLPARIQQLYDVPGKTMAICQGRCPLRVELLAPNGRPVQITDDLDGFWTGQYPQVRKDLFGRYPKHEWR